MHANGPRPSRTATCASVRTHSAAPQPLEVLVYSGEGAGYNSARYALAALQSCMSPGIEARFLCTSELLEGSWRDRCLLLVMPGGADLPYCRHLNGRGNRLLRSYVERGGSYLGICAGAYYACSHVEFEPGTELEVVGGRELGFFRGTARGAAYPGFDYLSEAGAHAAPVRFRLPEHPAASRPGSSTAAAAALEIAPHGSSSSNSSHRVSSSNGGGSRSIGGIPGSTGAAASLHPHKSQDSPDCVAAAMPEETAPSAEVACTPPRLTPEHLSRLADGDDRAATPSRQRHGPVCGIQTAVPDRGCVEPPSGQVTTSPSESDVTVAAGTGEPVAVTTAAAAPEAGSLDAVPPLEAREEVPGWVYCRDYSNGGPVFVPSPPSPLLATHPPAAGGPATSAAVLTPCCAAEPASSAGPSARDGVRRDAVDAVAAGGMAAPGGGVHPCSAGARSGVGSGGEGASGRGDGLDAGSGCEVLAVYPGLLDALAAVRCRVGLGVAVLCGTHPEIPYEALLGSVLLYDTPQARHVAALGAELAAWEPQRRQFWATLLLACCTAAAPASVAAVTQGGLRDDVGRALRQEALVN